MERWRGRIGGLDVGQAGMTATTAFYEGRGVWNIQRIIADNKLPMTDAGSLESVKGRIANSRWQMTLGTGEALVPTNGRDSGPERLAARLACLAAGMTAA